MRFKRARETRNHKRALFRKNKRVACRSTRALAEEATPAGTSRSAELETLVAEMRRAVGTLSVKVEMIASLFGASDSLKKKLRRA